MYLNDHQRTAFYEALGMKTKEFNQHVIIETNRTTARIFPAVCDVESPEFFERLDRVSPDACLSDGSSMGPPRPPNRGPGGGAAAWACLEARHPFPKHAKDDNIESNDPLGPRSAWR